MSHEQTVSPSQYVEFWQSRYDEGVMPWDLEGPSPHFKQFLDSENPAPGKMAALGCGRGHDAALFADAGFTVTGFDYAPGAITEARRLYGDKAQWVQADIFNLDDSYTGQFDYVLEHTCFCAIPRRRRDDYIETVIRLLRPGGEYIAVFWGDFDDNDGPPFSCTADELTQRFSPSFEILTLTPATQNARNREGREYFARMRKNDLQ